MLSKLVLDNPQAQPRLEPTCRNMSSSSDILIYFEDTNKSEKLANGLKDLSLVNTLNSHYLSSCLNRNKQLIKENDSLMNAVQQKDKCIAETSLLVNSLQSEILSLKLQLSECKEEHANEIDQLKTVYKEELDEVHNRNILLKQCISEIEDETHENEELIGELNNKLGTLKETLDSSEKNCAHWEHKYAQLKCRHNDLVSEHAETFNLPETRRIFLEDQTVNDALDELSSDFVHVDVTRQQFDNNMAREFEAFEHVIAHNNGNHDNDDGFIDFENGLGNGHGNDNENGNSLDLTGTGNGLRNGNEQLINGPLNFIERQSGLGHGNGYDHDDMEIAFGFEDEVFVDSGYSADESDQE